MVKTAELYQKLRKENVVVSMRKGRIRVSPHLFNSEQDIDRLIGVVTACRGSEPKLGLPSEQVQNRTSQHPVPSASRGLGYLGRTSHRSSVHRARRPDLLSRMFRPWLPASGGG